MILENYDELSVKIIAGTNQHLNTTFFSAPVDMSGEWPDPESRFLQYLYEYQGALDCDIEYRCQIGLVRNILRRKSLQRILREWGLGIESTYGWEKNWFGEHSYQFRRYLYVVDYERFNERALDHFYTTGKYLFKGASHYGPQTIWQTRLLQRSLRLPQS